MEQYKVTACKNWKVYNEILFLNKRKKNWMNVLFVPKPICFREKFYLANIWEKTRNSKENSKSTTLLRLHVHLSISIIIVSFYFLIQHTYFKL